MRNEGQKQQGSVAGVGRANGFIPSSFRTLSGYLKIVSSGASTVASSVRSAASAASSIGDRDDDILRDQVLWAGFDNLECEGGVLRRVLLLGLRTGFQVWDVDEAHNVHELMSKEDGLVHFLQMLPTPLPGTYEDKFTTFRPLLVVCGHGCDSAVNNVKDGVNAACNGGTSNSHHPASGCFGPFIVRFYSVSSQAFVHLLKFRSAVYSVRCCSRVVAVSQSAQIHCFNAATLEREYTILTNHVSTTPGSGSVGYGPLAVGPRWLAYSGAPVAISDAFRVPPQHLTHSASFPDRSSNGRLVAQFARESSRQLTAGIAILGDIGYKKLSRYCSELLPDSHDSMHPEPVGRRANGFTNGHFLDSVGMVIVRDIVSRSVVAQFRAHKSPISALCFDPSGMLLVTSSVQGHSINVFKIMTGSSNLAASDSGGSYVHLYKLQRGFTNAVIQDICFSDDGHCIVVSTSRGTNHLFAIPSSGRAAKSESPPVPSFRTDRPSDNGHSFTNRPTCSDDRVSDQQTVCMSSSPITLSAVSRVRSRDNGWRDTVTGATAAATGRVCSLPGVTACSFHYCKDNDMHTCSLKANYHFLVFSSSGYLVQYALGAFPNGAQSTVVDSGSIPHEGNGDVSKLMVEAVRKWNICQKQSQREKDGRDIYGENGSMDYHKIVSDGRVKVNGTYPRDHHAISRAKRSAEEKHHLYISEAELRMHYSGVPSWARSEIYFLRMIVHGAKTNEESATDGEIEIEKFLTDPIEVREKHLVPVFYHLPNCKSINSRTDPEYGIFGPLPMQQATDISHVEDITSSHSHATESGACLPFVLDETKETISIPSKIQNIKKNFVNNCDSPRVSRGPDLVNGRDREHTNMEALAVNNNNETLRRRNQSDDDQGDEFD